MEDFPDRLTLQSSNTKKEPCWYDDNSCLRCLVALDRPWLWAPGMQEPGGIRSKPSLISIRARTDLLAKHVVYRESADSGCQYPICVPVGIPRTWTICTVPFEATLPLGRETFSILGLWRSWDGPHHDA